MSIRVASHFQGRWSCFWATSYSLELELFDEYLFRRLGEAPLNATLLVLQQRLVIPDSAGVVRFAGAGLAAASPV